jgi:hypothetical protein
MKKTFTFLAIATLFTSAAFAQNNGRYDDNGNGYGREVVVNTPGRGYGYDDRGGRGFGEREKDMQIARISHDYHERIENVRDDFFMRWSKKQRIIENLQNQRDHEIHEVMERYYRGGYGQREHQDHDRRNW